MSSAEVNRVDTNPLPLSIPLRGFGWLAMAASLPLALRLVYEQTIMTWDEGPGMIGFTLAHIYPSVLILGLLAALCVHGWLLAVIVVWIRRRVSKRPNFPTSEWLQFIVLTWQPRFSTFHTVFGNSRLLKLSVGVTRRPTNSL